MTQNNAIDTAGRPQFLAYLAGNATNQTGDGTTVKVKYDTLTAPGFDLAGKYVTGAGNFFYKALFDGRYVFGTFVTISNLAAGHTSANLILYQNSSPVITAVTLNPINQAVSAATVLFATMEINCAAQDSIEWRIQVSGSTKTVTIGGGSAATACWGYAVA